MGVCRGSDTPPPIFDNGNFVYYCCSFVYDAKITTTVTIVVTTLKSCFSQNKGPHHRTRFGNAARYFIFQKYINQSTIENFSRYEK